MSAAEIKTVPNLKTKRIIGMRAQLLILFTLLFTIVFSLAAYSLLAYIDAVVLDQIRSDLTGTLVGAAASTNGDMLEELAREGQANADGYSDDPRYVELMAWLEQIHELEPRAWPFVYVPGPKENQIFYVVDLQVNYDRTRAAKFLEENDSAVYQSKGLNDLTVRPGDNPKGEFGIYTDPYGSWVTAYAPIRNSRGEIVGGMGVDFTADYVKEIRSSVLQRVEISFVVISLAMFLLILWVTGSFTRPITQLTNIADRIGEGDYGHQDNRRVQDELSRMAYAFSTMVDKVRVRENSLRQEVRQLKIEIDETKRKTNVDDIVETDFFKDLQIKATVLRSRANDQDQGENK
jgi:HAMP domain-containing protein